MKGLSLPKALALAATGCQKKTPIEQLSLTIYTRFLKPYSYWSRFLASLICLSGLIALRFSGRLMVILATAPFFSSKTGSASPMSILL